MVAPDKNNALISLKTEREIAIMREAGRILAEILNAIKPLIKQGVSGKDIEKVCEKMLTDYKVEPAFKNYERFPSVCCISVNDVVVHGVPSSKTFEQGDLVCFDLGIQYKGYYSDAAFAVLVGPLTEKDSEALRLLRATKKALKLGITKAKPGNTFGDIGNTIERWISSQGFGVVRELCGHGIGKHLHEEPRILNYGKRHTGPVIKEGMVFCIEPMVTMGDWHLQKAEDGFGYKTLDGSLACHFEHTIAITKRGPQVLTTL